MKNRDSFYTNLYLISLEVVKKIAIDNGWNEDYAANKFFSSVVYSELEREETKLWHCSYVTIAALFEDERAGCLAWPEVL